MFVHVWFDRSYLNILWTPTLSGSLSPFVLLCVCRIGTAGIAVQVVGSNWPKPHYSLLITGLCRFRVSSLLKERPFVLAEVKLSQYQRNTFLKIPPSVLLSGSAFKVNVASSHLTPT